MNSVVIHGIAVRKRKEFWFVDAVGRNGKTNLIRVWNLPENLSVGDKVHIEGSLMCEKIGYHHTKLALGVYANRVSEEWEAPEAVFCGEICRIGEKVRVSYNGKCILDVLIRIDENTLAPVIVWNDLADRVYGLFKVGDTVKVKGHLQSREYQKVINGKAIKKMTSEISAYSISSD